MDIPAAVVRHTEKTIIRHAKRNLVECFKKAFTYHSQDETQVEAEEAKARFLRVADKRYSPIEVVLHYKNTYLHIVTDMAVNSKASVTDVLGKAGVKSMYVAKPHHQEATASMCSGWQQDLDMRIVDFVRQNLREMLASHDDDAMNAFKDAVWARLFRKVEMLAGEVDQSAAGHGILLDELRSLGNN